jgi:hypothetical protein
MRKQHNTEVFRITGARAGLTDDVRGRQRRYMISMSVRTVSFVAAVLLWKVSTPLAWIALVLGLVLPYIAVVMANAGRENAPSLPASFIPPVARPALGPRGEQASPEPDAEREERRYTGRS